MKMKILWRNSIFAYEAKLNFFLKQLKKDDVAEVAEDDVFHRECCMAGCFGVHVSQWPSSNSLLGFCNTFFIEIVF